MTDSPPQPDREWLIAVAIRREEEEAGWLREIEAGLAQATLRVAKLHLDGSDLPGALEAAGPDLVLIPIPEEARLEEVVAWAAGTGAQHPLLLVGGITDLDLSPLGHPSVGKGASADGWRVAIEEALARGIGDAKRVPMEQFFRATFDASPVATLVAPRAGDPWISNVAFAELLGYRHEEFLALGVQRVIHPEDIQEGLARFGELLQGKVESYEIERRYLHKDGRAIWGRSIVRSFDHGDGGPPGIITTFQDVDEQRQTRKTLQATQALLSQMLDAMPEIFWALTPDWSEVRFINKAWEKAYGLPCSALVENPALWTEMMHEEDRDAALAYFEAHHGTICETEYRIVSASGEVRWIRDRAFPVHDDEGELVLVAGFGSDITEERRAHAQRKQLEDQMLRSQKLQSLGLLAGGVAHDFNNLLTVILANASLLERQSQLEAKGVHRVGEIVKASNQAADLCRQMLTFAGRGPLSANSLELDKIVTDMLAMLEVTISRQHIVRMVLAPTLPRLTGDITQLRQLVMNLILNAAEASPASGGKITVTTSVGPYVPGTMNQSYLVASCAERPLVVLEVKDEGCGMDSESLELIFDPFFTSKEGGRGLGLAAVMGIVRAHSGAVTVTSEVGEGTTFRLYFPAAERFEPRPVSSTASEEEWTGAGTLLVVDDQEQVLDTTRRLLEILGFEVLIATGGVEAVKIFEARGREIVGVLLDLTMPGMDGVQTLRALRELDPTVRVVLASGYASEALHDAAKEERVDATLEKPFDLKTLSRCLRDLLDSP